jgi:hypothetical protein
MAHRSPRSPIDYWRPLLPQLKRLNLELDQRMQQAWDTCASDFLTETQLLTSLLKLNTRGLECLPENWLKVGEAVNNDPNRCWSVLNPLAQINRCHPSHAEIAARFDFPIWMHAIELAGQAKTITCSHFCRAISDTFLSPWQGAAADVPPLIEFVGLCSGERIQHGGFGFDSVPRVLEDMPRTRQVIESLAKIPTEPDDFQYGLCIEEGKVVFRAFSVLGDFHVRASNDDIVGTRGLLTHLKDRFGMFTPDEIGELEEMIRNPAASEGDFQKFFEAHPHFFRRWDYREVYSHVYLTQGDQGPLIPDFILTNPEVQQATIVELKLPKPKIIRRQVNRERFADAVMEARAQLWKYQRWFDDKSHREDLVANVGMEVYWPRLAVIIGRASDFQPPVERQELAAMTPEIEVVTYDDILAFARNRLAIIGR